MDDAFDSWLKERGPEADADDGRLSPGVVVGNYVLEDLLGKGGFAEVYRAHERSRKLMRVSIKILHRLDEQSRLRFEREANILSQIHHPNFPRLISFGSCGTRPYMVTELLHPRELPHTDRGVARLIKGVCTAANVLHSKGYVHRDIKPSNILWRDDTPVLIDFGLACLKSDKPHSPSILSVVDGQRIVVGTAGYAAPEQFSGGDVDEASDVHAIGMLADACFGGAAPRCWRRIINRATNSRSIVRFATARKLAQSVAWRHIRPYVAGVFLVLVAAFNLFVTHWGWSSLLYGIGACYENGWVVSSNAVKAAKCYVRAATADTDFWLHLDPSAITIPRTPEEILKGAEEGKVEDMVLAADLYRDGVSVATNYARSAELYRKALAEGSFDAAEGLGILYETGRGCPVNPRAAFLLYVIAAENGATNAYDDVIRCYEQGIGVDRSIVKASEWQKRQAAHPFEKGRQNALDKVEEPDDQVAINQLPEAAALHYASAEGAKWSYVVESDGTATIVGHIKDEVYIPAVNTDFAGELVVPEAFEGHPVCRIGPYAFCQCKRLKSIILPSTLTSIGAFAFASGKRLETVYYKGSLPEMSELAYADKRCLMSFVLRDHGWESADGTLPNLWPREPTVDESGSSAIHRVRSCWSVQYWDGERPFSQDEVNALQVKVLEREARNGNVVACVDLSWLYENGLKGVKKDISTAIDYLRCAVAADGGSGIMYRVGELYCGASNGKKDYPAAYLWYVKSLVSQGVTDEWDRMRACQELAGLYRRGLGIKKDEAFAL